jgi:hypothetical protein
MTPATDYDIVNAMERFSDPGSFAYLLAALCHRADPVNFLKLKAAFPDVWAEYAELVQMIRHRDEERRAGQA